MPGLLLLLFLLSQGFFYLLLIAGSVGVVRIELQGALVGCQRRFEFARLCQGITAIVVGGATVLLGKSFGGGVVVPRAIARHATPLFIGKCLGCLLRLLLFQ